MGIQNREGALYMATGIDNSGLYSGVKQAEGIIGQLESTAKNAGAAMVGVFGGISLAGFVKQVIDVRSEFQNTEAMFKVFLGTADKASSFMKDIQKYAFNNVFEFKDLTQQASQLLAYQHSVENVIPILDKLSNVAAGVNQPLERFVELYNKAKSQDKLDLVDIRQWSVMGDVVSDMADMLGKSKNEIREMISTGRIGFNEIDALLNKLTEDGGRFNGMMVEKMKTLGDSIGLLQDSLSAMFNEIGEKSQSALRAGILSANYVVENYEKIGKILASLIASYGAYRTAVILVTEVEKGYTIAQLAQYRTLLMVEKAQKLLNATMLANPYVLLTTLLVGLVAVMWSLRDSTTAAENAQRKFNEAQDEYKGQVEERKSKSEALIRTIKDETETERAKIRAFKELQGFYPELFGNMSMEAVKLAEENKLKKERNIIEEEYTKQKYQQMIADAEARKDAAQKNMNASVNQFGGGFSSNFGSVNYDRYKKDFLQAEADVKEWTKALEECKKAEEEVANVNLSNISDEIKKTTNNIANLKQKIEDLRSGKEKPSKEGETVLELIGARQKELKQAEDALATLTGQDKAAIKSGIDANRLKAETVERLAAIKEAQKQFLQQEAAGELEIRQERIILMEEGSAKTLEQIQLDYDKRMAEIAKHGDELVKQQQEIEKKIWEAANPDWKERGMEFKPGTTAIDQLSAVMQKQLADQAGLAGEAMQKKQSDLLKQTLAQYQDYAARRLELEKKYNEDVATMAKGRKEANAAQIDASIAEAKKKLEEALSQLNLEEFKEQIDWGIVFGDLGNLSTSSLESLRDKLAEFIKGVGKSMSPEIMKEVSDAFNNIKLEMVDRKPLEQLNVSLADYKAKTEAVAAARKKLNDLEALGYDKTENLGEVTKELSDAEKERLESLTALTKAVNAIGSKGQEVVNAGSDIVNMLRDLGVEVPEALDGTLHGLGKIMSSLENIDLAKPFSVVTSAIGALSGLGSMVGSIFGLGKNNDEKLMREIEKCEDLVNLYGKLIDKQKEYISTMTGGAAIKQAEEAADLIQRSLAASRSSLESWFRTGASGNHHSMAYRINRDLKEQLKGAGITDISQVLNFDSSQWEGLQKNIELWAKLPEEVRAYGEAVIDAKLSTEELAEIMKEAITGVSFSSLSNSLDDLVTQFDLTFDAIGESFEDTMSKAILNLVKKQVLTEKLMDWYDNFTEAMKDEVLSESEAQALRKQYEDTVIAGNERYKAAMAAAGIDIAKTSESDTENTLKGAYAKASQESIDLLAGQTGAQRVAVEKILQILQMMSPANRSDFVAGIRADLQMLYDLQVAGWKEVTAIKEISKDIKECTEKIEGYTKEIRDSNEDIKDNTKRSADMIDNIEQNGLDVKLPPI